MVSIRHSYHAPELNSLLLKTTFFWPPCMLWDPSSRPGIKPIPCSAVERQSLNHWTARGTPGFSSSWWEIYMPNETHLFFFWFIPFDFFYYLDVCVCVCVRVHVCGFTLGLNVKNLQVCKKEVPLISWVPRFWDFLVKKIYLYIF